MRDEERRGERGDEVRAAREHQLDGLVIQPDAVFDRVDACADGVLDALGGLRVSADDAEGFVSLLHTGAHLLLAERRRARVHARRHHSAAGEELDGGRARAELLANGLADLVRAVGFAGDEAMPVAAGHRHAVAGGEDARAFDESRFRRPGQFDVQVVRRPEVAHGGEASFNRSPGVLLCAPCAPSQRLAAGVVHLAGVAAGCDVDVAVDQAGQDEGAAAVDHLRARGLIGCAEATDDTVAAGDVRTAAERSRRGVEDGAPAENERRRFSRQWSGAPVVSRTTIVAGRWFVRQPAASGSGG